jgi:epoxyqueuosine reductase QueG
MKTQINGRYKSALTRRDIVVRAQDLGAEMVGFAPVSRWDDFAEVPPEFRPRAIWPLARTVIVLGLPLWLPIVEAAPSELGREQYIITNELLDEAAYRLALFLNHHGHAAINLPRDGQGEPETLAETPTAIFSHIWAGQLAGLGVVGRSRALLTKAFGPRQRLISVFTELELEGDPLLKVDFCGDCRDCERICPVQALTSRPGQGLADFDGQACAGEGRRLRAAFRNPCGFCLKVCPVGADRELFGSTNTRKYFDEAAALAANPHAPEYQDWLHIRKYGGFPLPEDPPSIR